MVVLVAVAVLAVVMVIYFFINELDVVLFIVCVIDLNDVNGVFV